MRKITIRLHLFAFLFMLLATPQYQLSAKNKIPRYASPSFKNLPIRPYGQKQDKNLLKGIWERTDAAGELKISEILPNGALRCTFTNPKSITIEKAVWSNTSDVLRIHILFREDSYPGSSFSLNYIAEKDQLLGTYFDALTNESYAVSFKRVK